MSPHPHPLRSNPVLPEDTLDQNTMTDTTQDVGAGLKRTPAIKRANTVSTTDPRRQPALKRASTVKHEAGLPVAPSTERGSGLSRQPAVRRPNPSSTDTEPEMKENHEDTKENTKEVESARPFSFARGADVIDPKKTRVPPTTPIPESPETEGMEANSSTSVRAPSLMIRPFSFNHGADMIDPKRSPISPLAAVPEYENYPFAEPGKFKTHASVLITHEQIAIQPIPIHLPPTQSIEQSTEVILLNNGLRAVVKQLDNIDRIYHHENLTAVMIHKIKAQMAKSQKFLRQFHGLGFSNSGTEISEPVRKTEDSKHQIEEWRSTIQNTLNTISFILKYPPSKGRDEALMAALTKCVEDAEQFVASFDVDGK